MTDIITVDGIHIAQKIVGDADTPPVILLHGWGANISLLEPLGNGLARVGYRSYMLDLPGFGESALPPRAWTVHQYAEFVLHYAAFHQLKTFHLFGHSFGGRLGLILGSQHGDRIDKMVLANSAGIRPRLPIGVSLRLNTYKALRNGLRNAGLGMLADRLSLWYNQRYGSTDFQNVSGIMRETFVKVVNQDLQRFAKQVKPSTLLLWGDQDEDTPLWQGKLLEQLIPDAGLVVYEGAGHYSYLDRLVDAIRVADYFYKQA
ncbi:MAG: alpha/beta hydrolase [Anaerolineae bacterium]